MLQRVGRRCPSPNTLMPLVPSPTPLPTPPLSLTSAPAPRPPSRPQHARMQEPLTATHLHQAFSSTRPPRIRKDKAYRTSTLHSSPPHANYSPHKQKRDTVVTSHILKRTATPWTLDRGFWTLNPGL
ncbi:hypothetical protein E2C01_042890 [Portunus trituberculatus]|uniref:Uncharacterized protein n=1 Tax=Portunus trituberculatus TaxID=210409 RepID=A0A5B7FUL6_PORTR|nr:hypothetical protein [Portunus trituberculatus]